MIVTTQDLLIPGVGRYCSGGARRWFILHDLDWNKFVFDGLPEEALLATGDAMALTVVENARRRAAEGK